MDEDNVANKVWDADSALKNSMDDGFFERSFKEYRFFLTNYDNHPDCEPLAEVYCKILQKANKEPITFEWLILDDPTNPDFMYYLILSYYKHEDWKKCYLIIEKLLAL